MEVLIKTVSDDLTNGATQIYSLKRTFESLDVAATYVRTLRCIINGWTGPDGALDMARARQPING